MACNSLAQGRARLLLGFLPAQALDPFNDANDIRVEGKILLPVGDAEKAARLLIAHGSPETSAKQSQLFAGRRSRLSRGVPIEARPSLANELLL